jgi:two-component sensor histidine kinase
MPTPQASRGTILRQRELLAELGASALRGADLDELLNNACRMVADGMGVKFTKVLEYLPDENALLVRAGVGWRPGVVGHARLDAGAGSPAGHALRTNGPVISNDLANETRFATPALLREHGIERAINVIIRGDTQPFGVLEVDGRRPGDFTEENISFLQGVANLLGLAVERGRREAELRRALDSHEALLREADHRVKNSLQLVASLLTLQRGRLADPQAVAALDDAIARVHAVARSHRALAQGRDLRTLPLDEMLGDLCAHIGQLSAPVKVECSVSAGLEMDTERAIPLGLIVSELLTNAVRHAYKEGESGVVRVAGAMRDRSISIVVSDCGDGIAAMISSGHSLGITIVHALVRQIGARMDVLAVPGEGTRITLLVPRRPGL